MRASSPPKGYSQPAEWQPHDDVWLAWPSHQELWQENLGAAQDEFVALCRGIAKPHVNPTLRCETVNIVVRPGEVGDADMEVLRERLPFAVIHRALYGDIWLRDTAPIFLTGQKHDTGDAAGLVAACFTFNGWGGKYELPGDKELATEIAKLSQTKAITLPFVLEGGAVEVDGKGTVLTTRQCLLNANRNPEMDASSIERAVLEALGGSKMLWVTDGLLNDHTDGHIDTIARFVSDGVVVCMEPLGASDPNQEVLVQIRKELALMRDAAGQKLEVMTVPSAGQLLNDDDEVMPASHVNFYIANESVIVPVYGTKYDDKTIYAYEKLFPGRTIVGAMCRAILAGGGGFHCITQQVPRL